METRIYQNEDQISGKGAHQTIENKNYSTKKNVLQSIEVYSEKYGLHGKIDIFDIEKGLLSERKKEIKTIYDGYIFQVFAQYFCLLEMEYKVEQIQLYDMTHNKVYKIKKPEEDLEMFTKFEKVIFDLRNFILDDANFKANPNKCMRCIYSNLCDSSAC
jgi:CRISPR-associated protein Cas4